MKRGDKQTFAIYWSECGPQLCPIVECVWTGETWAHPGSPAAIKIEEDQRKGKVDSNDG